MQQRHVLLNRQTDLDGSRSQTYICLASRDASIALAILWLTEEVVLLFACRRRLGQVELRGLKGPESGISIERKGVYLSQIHKIYHNLFQCLRIETLYSEP